MLEEYINNKIEVTDEIIVFNGNLIMESVESNLMRETADILCSNNGSVLNVGFGLGIIDTYIRNHNPKEHHIIEVHPQIQQNAKSMGFDIYCGKWEDIVKDFVKEGKTFDSIYFDTYVFDYEKHPQWRPFTKIVPKLLKPNGIYSYFNGTAASWEGVSKLLDTFGWEKNVKLLPSPFEKNKTYELIWYINSDS